MFIIQILFYMQGETTSRIDLPFKTNATLLVGDPNAPIIRELASVLIERSTHARALCEQIGRTVADVIRYDRFERSVHESDQAQSLIELVQIGRGVCRHQTPVSTAMAEYVGLNASTFVFTYTDETRSYRNSTHAATLVNLESNKNPIEQANYIVIDPTHPEISSYDLPEYLEIMAVYLNRVKAIHVLQRKQMMWDQLNIWQYLEKDRSPRQKVFNSLGKLHHYLYSKLQIF